MVRAPFTMTGRISIVHIADQTSKRPDYTFTVKELAEELDVKKPNMSQIVKSLYGHGNLAIITEIKGAHKAEIYFVTKKGIKYANLIKTQEGLL